jgi:hypothetical protein
MTLDADGMKTFRHLARICPTCGKPPMVVTFGCKVAVSCPSNHRREVVDQDDFTPDTEAKVLAERWNHFCSLPWRDAADAMKKQG